MGVCGSSHDLGPPPSTIVKRPKRTAGKFPILGAGEIAEVDKGQGVVGHGQATSGTSDLWGVLEVAAFKRRPAGMARDCLADEGMLRLAHDGSAVQADLGCDLLVRGFGSSRTEAEVAVQLPAGPEKRVCNAITPGGRWLRKNTAASWGPRESWSPRWRPFGLFVEYEHIGRRAGCKSPPNRTASVGEPASGRPPWGGPDRCQLHPAQRSVG